MKFRKKFGVFDCRRCGARFECEGRALECGAASFSREIHADRLGQLLVRCEAQCNAWF